MKILASDFDETIYFEDDSATTNKNINMIKNFTSHGNIFCIITGRNYTSLKQLLNKYNITYSYLICEDGAKIFNNMDYCIDTTYLNKKEIEKVREILDELECDYYLDDGYNKTEYLEDVVKIVVNCKDEEEKERIVEYIKDKIDIHIYASRTHVNIINKSVNKSNALKKLINIENLNYDNIYVIGDNDNDYEMLKTFDGATIKNHHKVLDKLNKKEFNTLSDYIEELMKN